MRPRGVHAAAEGVIPEIAQANELRAGRHLWRARPFTRVTPKGLKTLRYQDRAGDGNAAVRTGTAGWAVLSRLPEPFFCRIESLA